ncbi:MAG: CpaF/VirB11 family protein [Candidatus Moduliflexus flocculans]|nr:CpaF/VirB11 family protein [Candidatus Moduliflexus flocculans]
MTTIHGGTVEEAPMRLEQLALAFTPELGLPAVRWSLWAWTWWHSWVAFTAPDE